MKYEDESIDQYITASKLTKSLLRRANFYEAKCSKGKLTRSTLYTASLMVFPFFRMEHTNLFEQYCSFIQNKVTRRVF